MAPDQEVRTAALNAAVRLLSANAERTGTANPAHVIRTAETFEKYINGGEKV